MTEPTHPAPPEPTNEQLRGEVDALKKKIAGMVPSAERDALLKELETTKAELAESKKPKPEAPKSKGWFPRLF